MIIMRLRPVKRLMVLGALVCVTSIGAGCTQPRKQGLPLDSGSSVPNTPVPSPSSQELPATDTGVEKQQAEFLPSESASSGEWLLQRGLFGVQHGMWLGWISFAVGLFGTGLALIVMRRCNDQCNSLSKTKDDLNKFSQITDTTDTLEQDLLRHSNRLTAAIDEIKQLKRRCSEYSKEINRLLEDYQPLKNRQAEILDAINELRIQQKPEPQSYAIPAPGLISTPLAASQPSAPSSAQKQAELTAAVNRGDRQVIKSEARLQLNITHASENAISMGRLNETQLEEVSAGGSYWAASFAGETWLYPTEQTLKGYSQSQRPTGIFNYSRQPISSAQVVSPASLRFSGNFWQVVEMGSIAVPG